MHLKGKRWRTEDSDSSDSGFYGSYKRRSFGSKIFHKGTSSLGLNGWIYPVLDSPIREEQGFLTRRKVVLIRSSTTYDSNNIIRGVEDAAAVGIIRDRSKSDKAYIFHGVERMPRDCSGQQSGIEADICLKVQKFPKRTDFLHRVPTEPIGKKDEFAFLDPKDCRIDRLPVTYSQFAMFIPSIMHHVENALLTDHLCNRFLAPIEFSSPAIIFPALCAPAANEDGDYQRLEFLGDSILKMLTSTALVADHQNLARGISFPGQGSYRLERATGYSGTGDRIGQIHPDQIIHR